MACQKQRLLSATNQIDRSQPDASLIDAFRDEQGLQRLARIGTGKVGEGRIATINLLPSTPRRPTSFVSRCATLAGPGYAIP